MTSALFTFAPAMAGAAVRMRFPESEARAASAGPWYSAAVPWCKALFKGTQVLARCDEQGALLAEGGRVEIRYRPGESRAYRAAVRNLTPAAGEPVLPDDHCSDSAQPGQGAKPRDAARASRTRSRKSVAAAPRGPLPDGAIVVYSDGACSGNPGPAGAGVVLIDGDAVVEHSAYLGQGTNNIAELTAIDIALEVIGQTDRPVRIHTDSQYSIGVLVKGWKAKANAQLVERIRKRLRDLRDVELIYVPGHAGVALNERADELAVEAVRSRRSAGPLRPG